MKISNNTSVREDWDDVKSWNYRLDSQNRSVVYAELAGVHGEVKSKDVERIYYIVSGKGEFYIDGKIVTVESGDVLTVPMQTRYNYWPIADSVLKVVLFMEIWKN